MLVLTTCTPTCFAQERFSERGDDGKNERKNSRFLIVECKHSSKRAANPFSGQLLESEVERGVAANSLRLTDCLALALLGNADYARLPSTLFRNKRLGFGVNVPEGFSVSERYYVAEQSLVSTFEKQGVGRVRLSAQKVLWPWIYITRDLDNKLRWVNDPFGMMADQYRKFRRHELSVYLPDNDDNPLSYDPNEPRMPADSPRWRIGSLEPSLRDAAFPFGITAVQGFYYRYWHYEKVGEDRSLIVLYVLYRDNFVAVDFEIPTSSIRRPDAAERLRQLVTIPITMEIYPPL
jgi:hypothetical protein